MIRLHLQLPIQAGLIEISGLTVRQDTGAFEQLLACGQHYAEQYGDVPISSIPGVQAARRLFRNLGIEPTKHRPASEAMLRRFLKAKEVYSVNRLVDISNWCALDFLLPNSMYDATKIAGDITLRQGLPGEMYLGLNNQEIHLEGRYTLTDDRGPFGSPITDSRRSCVDMKTRNVICIIYAPADFDMDLLHDYTNRYARRIVEFCQGRVRTATVITL